MCCCRCQFMQLQDLDQAQVSNSACTTPEACWHSICTFDGTLHYDLSMSCAHASSHEAMESLGRSKRPKSWRYNSEAHHVLGERDAASVSQAALIRV